MSKSDLTGAAALLAAPLLVLAGVALAPTVSDDAAVQVAALTDHRGAAIAGLTLQTIAISLLIGGVIWLAVTLASRTPRLALAGGVLAVVGSLIPLFENGVAATAPTLVAALDPARATTAIARIDSSAAVSALEPFSLLADLGLALLAIAAVKAGAPRWAAILVAVGAFGEGVGFGSGTRALILAAFAVLFAGFAGIVRALRAEPARGLAGEAAPA
jgi:hypothetical protein